MRIASQPAWRGALLAVGLTCATADAAMGQWLELPLPGTPRTAEGKPNLKAPVPHATDGKPDLSGIWNAPNYDYVQFLPQPGTEPPMLPDAAALYKHRVDTLGYDVPMTYCMPHGVPEAMFVAGHPFKIIQTPRVVVLLFEEFHKYRQIFTDGRQLPVDPDPAWYGYSVGRWEGDTLVVETAGFKEGSWLDNRGHPHTDALRTTERFHRVDFGSLELSVTIDDPKAYSQPWTSRRINLVLRPDTELLEHLCENNRDLERLKTPPTTGTVTKLEWTNPHIWFFMDVKFEDGSVANWGFEMASPSQLLRAGWKNNSMKVGDVVTVEAKRARDGSNHANAQNVMLASTGQRLFAGSPQAQ